jgi:hypothetical protein
MSSPGPSPPSSGILWCRHCRREFRVVAQRRKSTGTPTTEMLVCPYCSQIRRFILPDDLEGPVDEVLKIERRTLTRP